MQVLIAISGFCGFCSRIGNTPCTTPFDFLFVISIHVPAWGTTTNEAARLSVVHISIHVPAWGTTALVYSEKEDVCDFNPRSREGNDKRMLLIAAASYYFNPRSREGNDDLTKVPVPASEEISIHVPARGTTDESQYQPDCLLYFNPRSREGNDEGEISEVAERAISIHVPARGTTIEQERTLPDAVISIHVPARGTTKIRGKMQ